MDKDDRIITISAIAIREGGELRPQDRLVDVPLMVGPPQQLEPTRPHSRAMSGSRGGAQDQSRVSGPCQGSLRGGQKH